MDWEHKHRRYEVAIYRGHYLFLSRRPHVTGYYCTKVRVPSKIAHMLVDASGNVGLLLEWERRAKALDSERVDGVMSCGKEVEGCMQSIDRVADWLIDKINELNIDWSVDKVILMKCLSRE